MPRPRMNPQEQALEELSESPYDEPDNDADDAGMAPRAAGYAELPAFMNSMQGHSGPALERYGVFAGNTSDIQTAQAERMRALLYNQARDEAALKGVHLPADYYDDLGGGYAASIDAPAMHGNDADEILRDVARMNADRTRAGRY